MHDSAFRFLEERLTELAGRLSLSTWAVGPAAMLEPLLEENRARFPASGPELDRLNEREHYRQTLSLLRERVRATRLDADHAYRDSATLVADLRVIEASLLDQRQTLAVTGDIHDVIRQAEVFGFHFATLDIRDHSRRFEAAVHDSFARANVASDYRSLSETDKMAVLAARSPIRGRSFPRIWLATRLRAARLSRRSEPCSDCWTASIPARSGR